MHFFVRRSKIIEELFNLKNIFFHTSLTNGSHTNRYAESRGGKDHSAAGSSVARAAKRSRDHYNLLIVRHSTETKEQFRVRVCASVSVVSVGIKR